MLARGTAPKTIAAVERHHFMPPPLPGLIPLSSVRIVSNLTGRWIEERRYQASFGRILINEVHASGLSVQRVER